MIFPGVCLKGPALNVSEFKLPPWPTFTKLSLLQGEAFETDKIDAVMGDLDESEEVEATRISYVL